MAIKKKQQDIRALLVEENEIIIDSLGEIMRSLGYIVITHKDPSQAINMMKGGSVGLVIADDKCGSKEGLEILEIAQKEVPTATRLLLTSRVNDDAVQSAVKDRLVYRYITKPWLTEDLILTLKTAADTFQLAEKNTSLTLEKNDLERTVRDLEKMVASGGGKEGGGAAVVQATQAAVVAGDGDAGTIMQAMIEMLYVFHPNLKSNAIRTMALVKTVAESLQLEKIAAEALYQAAGLHDIAIPGVDRPIIRRWLRDPEKCNKDEMKIIEHHPNHAIEMLKPYPMFKEAEPLIRAHHEDWNGKGYPNRLKGETIPFEARVLRVALDFCSKHADPIQTMLDIEELSGDLYDPDAVRAIAKAVPLTEMPIGEREILLIELKEGMTLGRDISNANGFLLFPKGKTLSQSMCDKLFNIDRISPLDPYVLVYC